MSFFIGGRPHALATSADATTFAFNNSHGHTMRVPPSVGRVVERLAAGPATLSPADLDHLDLVEIEVVDATTEVKRAMATQMQADGVATMLVNQHLALVPKHYTAKAPIGPITYFKLI